MNSCTQLALAAEEAFYCLIPMTYAFDSSFLHTGLDYTDIAHSHMYHHSDTPGHKHLYDRITRKKLVTERNCRSTSKVKAKQIIKLI